MYRRTHKGKAQLTEEFRELAQSQDALSASAAAPGPGFPRDLSRSMFLTPAVPSSTARLSALPKAMG